MNKVIKNILTTLVLVAMSFGIAYLAVEAWDDTMSNEQVIEFMEKYPDDVKLQKIAARRGLLQD